MTERIVMVDDNFDFPEVVLDRLKEIFPEQADLAAAVAPVVAALLPVRFAVGDSTVARPADAGTLPVVFVVSGTTAPVNAVAGRDVWLKTV